MSENTVECNIEIEEIVELEEGTVNDIKEYIRNEDPSKKDLKRILRAEKAGKDRSTAKEFLEKKIHEQEVSKNIDQLKNQITDESVQGIEITEDHVEVDIGVLKAVFEPGNAPELILDIGGTKVPLSNTPIPGLMSENRSNSNLTMNIMPGQNQNTRSVQSSVNSGNQSKNTSAKNNATSTGNSLTQQKRSTNQQGSTSQAGTQESESSNIGGSEATESSSTSKTPKESIKSELESRFDLEDSEIEGKTLSELKDMRDNLYEKKSLKNELKEEYSLKDEDLVGKDIDDLKELKDKLSDKSALKKELRNKYDVNPEGMSVEEMENYKDRLMSVEEKKEELKNRFSISEQQVENKDLEGLKRLEEKLEKKEEYVNRLASYGYEKEKLEDEEVSYLETQMNEIEEKKNLIQDLDVDYPDSKLKDIELSQLQALKNEKKEREQLIEDLKNEDLDEKELREASTKDLRKLKSEMLAPEIDTNEQKGQRVTDEDIGKMQEEAAQELEMLMGAVGEEEKEEREESENSINKIKGLKTNFNNLIKTKDEEQDKKLREDKVLDLLEGYEKDSNDVKTAIKTAQVMKGYLENKLEVDREMTYQELAQKVAEVNESREEHDPDLEILGEFFNQIHHQIYSGNVYIEDICEIIEASERVIRKSK